jgi:hypothetical protein
MRYDHHDGRHSITHDLFSLINDRVTVLDGREENNDMLSRAG